MGMSTLVKGYGNARLWAAMAVLLPFTVWGIHIEVPPGAVPEHADTEVSTNMPFVVDGERTREIKMRFALDGCASNCIQVAFGRDADGDGVLGADESETLYGWRNGRYFAESVADGLRWILSTPGLRGLVLDADALTLLGRLPPSSTASTPSTSSTSSTPSTSSTLSFALSPSDCILTPHPGEAAYILMR